MSANSGINDDLKRALTNAWQNWQHEPLSGDKYIYFDDLARDRYGIHLYANTGSVYTGYDIIDEHKFSMFVLKWST